MGISWINKGSEINLGFYCSKAMLIEMKCCPAQKSWGEINTLHVRESRE